MSKTILATLKALINTNIIIKNKKYKIIDTIGYEKLNGYYKVEVVLAIFNGKQIIISTDFIKIGRNL